MAPIGVDEQMVVALREVLGPERVHSDPAELGLYRRDASTITAGTAGAVCFPETTDEVARCVQVCRRLRRPFVARGSGTGLAGGAVPVEGALVIATTRMNRILQVDARRRSAWVQPGVLNLDLTRSVADLGFHFAPDPSSQAACSIGGNVANNAGGPHCLAQGVTSAHVLAVEVVLADGDVVVLGATGGDPVGYDLRGAFVGGEGMLGIATAIEVRLSSNAPSVCTVLVEFDSVAAAAATVSGVIAAGVVPAAMEMMDQRITAAVEDFVGAGLPRDAAAVLLVEIDGMPTGVSAARDTVAAVARRHGARAVRVAADEQERAGWWKARKSAFGAVARVAPNYYLHDTVVPRTRLVEMLLAIEEIARRHELIVMNVFHAGDGNLHPLLVFDARAPGALERVHSAGEEIVEASLQAGGVLSGEHGIGLEKRDFMPLLFGPEDLDAQARLREVFDPTGMANPTKVLPAGSRCGDLQQIPDGVWV